MPAAKTTARSRKKQKPEKRLLEFAERYQLADDADLLEAIQIYADEIALIEQLRSQIALDGLTMEMETRGGIRPVAHPLLQELPRHVEAVNRLLGTMAEICAKRGARKEVKSELAAFRISS